MSSKTMFFKENASFSRAERRLACREDLIYNVTEDLLVIMEDKGITKKELSRLLGKSGAYITQLLNGTRNMTLGTFSDVCFALEISPEIKLPVDNPEIKNQVDSSEIRLPVIDGERKDWIKLKRTQAKRNPTEITDNKVLKFESKPFWSPKKVAA